MAKQTYTGKAFEYSIAKNYYDSLCDRGLSVVLLENPALEIARRCYDTFDGEEKGRYDIAAKNTIETLILLEPGLTTQQSGNDILQIRLASDAEGQSGDVRDIIFSRNAIKPKWEIGFSAKNNHEAVKHSRLSLTIDFGREWLGYPCSPIYFDEIRPIFDWIRNLLSQDTQTKWSDIGDDKAQRVYKPVLQAFRKELWALQHLHKDVPEKLLNYLIGRAPFYKMIKDDRNNLVVVKAFNMRGELNKKVGAVKPRASTDKINAPSRIIEFDFKEESDNTLMMILDKGWQISFRIHSATTRLEPSLKFDINLIGNPPVLFTQHLFALP